MLYRKKPIAVRAVQYDGTKLSGDEIIKQCADVRWDTNNPGMRLICKTLEWPYLIISPGDWIVGPGVEGEYWPVKGSVFDKSYERVEP